MSVRVTTNGLNRLRAKVSRAANFLGKGGINATLNHHGALLVESYRAKVQTFMPGPVEDLKEATKRSKMKGGFAVYPILKRTGDMLNSMYHTIRNAGGVWSIAIGFRGVDRTGASNEVKALAHMEGTDVLPQRDFTQVPKGWLKKLSAEIRRNMGWKA